MAQPPQLYDSYTAVGAKEDISDLIHDISPTETPFLTMIGTSSAKQKFHQHQEDALIAPNGANAAVEGDDAVLVEPTPTELIGNHCQISTKIFGVSGTLETTEKYGRDSELAYQAAKSARELKTDVDMAMTGVNQGNVAGNSTTARRSASFEAFLKTNVPTLGAGGANGGWNGSAVVARTDGTPRTFTQALLDAAIALAWGNGGKPDKLVTGASQKENIAGFDGVGPRRTDAAGKTVIATVDIYMSHFGDFDIMPSRHIRKTSGVDRNVFGVDSEYAKIAYLRSWQQFDLAKTGDSIRRQMLVEWTLEVSNEKAHLLVPDLAA